MIRRLGEFDTALETGVLLLEVTEADIEAGQQFAGFKCPVAVAAHRMYPGRSFTVWGGSITDLETDITFTFPPNALEWVGDYDQFGHGEPISFGAEMKE